MFRFANPQYFWLLPVIPALILLFWLAARNRRRRLERFGRMQVLEELMPEVSTGRVTLKFILFCTAVTLLILAAAPMGLHLQELLCHDDEHVHSSYRKRHTNG